MGERSESQSSAPELPPIGFAKQMANSNRRGGERGRKQDIVLSKEGTNLARRCVELILRSNQVNRRFPSPFLQHPRSHWFQRIGPSIASHFLSGALNEG